MGALQAITVSLILCGIGGGALLAASHILVGLMK